MSGAPPVLNVGPTEKVSPAGWSRFFELLNCTDSDQVTCAQGHDTADIVKAYDQLFKEFPRGSDTTSDLTYRHAWLTEM